MVAQARPPTDRQRWRPRWLGRGGNSGASSDTSSDTNSDTSWDTSRDQVSASGSDAGSDTGSDTSAPRRVGDRIVHPDIDGSLALPVVYARLFIAFLQEHPALQDLLGGWVSVKALQLRYYPEFLLKFADAPPFRRIVVAFREEDIVEKRCVKLTARVVRGRNGKHKRKRRNVVEYLIPMP